MSKKVLVPISDGSEELEAITVVNLMRRAGFEVVIAGDSEVITGARNSRIIVDDLIENINDINDFDLIVLPGGLKGVNSFSKNEKLKNLVKNHIAAQKYTGAICAAPLALKSYEVLEPTKILTSFPAVKDELIEYKYMDDKVVTDDKLVTSRGVGTAIDFALELIELLESRSLADKIAEEIVYTR